MEARARGGRRAPPSSSSGVRPLLRRLIETQKARRHTRSESQERAYVTGDRGANLRLPRLDRCLRRSVRLRRRGKRDRLRPTALGDRRGARPSAPPALVASASAFERASPYAFPRAASFERSESETVSAGPETVFGPARRRRVDDHARLRDVADDDADRVRRRVGDNLRPVFAHLRIDRHLLGLGILGSDACRLHRDHYLLHEGGVPRQSVARAPALRLQRRRTTRARSGATSTEPLPVTAIVRLSSCVSAPAGNAKRAAVVARSASAPPPIARRTPFIVRTSSFELLFVAGETRARPGEVPCAAPAATTPTRRRRSSRGTAASDRGSSGADSVTKRA